MIQFDEHIFQMGGSTTNQFPLVRSAMRRLISWGWSWRVPGSTAMPGRTWNWKLHDAFKRRKGWGRHARPWVGWIYSHEFGTHLINECVFLFLMGLFFLGLGFCLLIKNTGRLIGFITYTLYLLITYYL